MWDGVKATVLLARGLSWREWAGSVVLQELLRENYYMPNNLLFLVNIMSKNKTH